ncbi:MAG TPA: serine hydrolase domain-containing protein [Kofleriaceae bacterium]|nr:serine hydrolase domain-containing protein [Kofleriaceae bacterium]
MAHREPALDDELDALLQRAIARGIFTAASVAVGDAGSEIIRFGIGRTRAVPDAGEMCDSTAIFDLASLTKPIATAAIAMKLVARGALALDDLATRWIGARGAALDPRITAEHLLGHGSGLPPHIKLYEQLRAGQRAGQATARDALIALAAAQPLEAAPGARAAYSDLGYALAGAMVEGAGGAPLEDLFAREIVGPLGLERTRYVDLTKPKIAWPTPVVATEVDVPPGEVHDENAHAAGGVCGHAGLFGDAVDVSRFARAIIAAANGDATIFEPQIVRTFLDTSAGPSTTWRLGWDTPSRTPGVSNAGDAWPRNGGVGHLGFTGTSMWLDLPRRRWLVLLTNRVHPSRTRPEAALIKEIRRAAGDLVATL